MGVPKMKCIIAGSRSINDYSLLNKVISKYNLYNIITTVVCGEALGFDKLGKLWAEEHSIEVLSFPARWDVFGKSAGYRRNEAMAHLADAAIVVHNGSPGSRHMVEIAKKFGLKLYEEIINVTNNTQ